MSEDRIKRIIEKSNALKRFWGDSERVSGDVHMNDGESDTVWITADRYFEDVDFLLAQLEGMKIDRDKWELRYYRLRDGEVTK